MSEKVCCATCKYVSGVNCLNPTGHCDLTIAGYPKWEPKERDHDTKTLLDEFAMAVVANGTMLSEIVNATNNPMTAHDVAKNAYTIAAAMMKERARRDEMGNIKEVAEQ